MTTEYVCECTHQPGDHRGRAYACRDCDCSRYAPDIQRASNAAGLDRLERGLAELEATDPAVREASQRLDQVTASIVSANQQRDAARTGQPKSVRDRAALAATTLAATRKLLIERTAQLAEAQARRDQATENAAQWMRATYTARAELASANTELDLLRADRRTWSETDD